MVGFRFGNEIDRRKASYIGLELIRKLLMMPIEHILADIGRSNCNLTALFKARCAVVAPRFNT